MESVCSFSKLSTEFVDSRREPVANSVHTAHLQRRRDSTRQLTACIKHYGIVGNKFVY